LKVVVMSATMETGPVATFLGARELEVTARTWPLAIRYRPAGPGRDQSEAVASALDELLADPDDDGGHVLVFLPGAPEIRRVLRHLSRRQWRADLVPLHGSLSSAEQDAALAPGPRRRFILSTNIAETSLTIEGVTAVIDGGRRKAHSHDPRRGVDRLDTVRISRAGAESSGFGTKPPTPP
jgi:ATP-dependent helicase HrpB